MRQLLLRIGFHWARFCAPTGQRPDLSEADSLTRTTFLENLDERVETLSGAGVDAPGDLETRVVRVLDEAAETFENPVFRYGAAHLLNGLDMEMAADPGGLAMLNERLWALPENLQNYVDIASERRGLAV